MNILPANIRLCSIINDSNSKVFGVYLESNTSHCLIQGTPKKECDISILKDLYNKSAYASTMLYFVENFDLLDKEIDKNKLYEDINSLLHKRCRVIEEQAPLLTKIGNYPIYEGENYILRGEGKKKILECFDTSKLKEAAMDNKEDLAWDLVNFMKDFDTYSFVDDYDSDEDAVEQIKSDLSTKFGIESIKTMLNSIKEDADEESYDLEALESLLARLDTFSLEEEAGTQASDIASKVDYSFQSAPTTAKKRRKYLPVEIKELDESTYLNLTGFIKDVDGLYKRGNYVVVKETATDKIKVIHKNKLYEAENIEAVGNTKIAEYIEKKLNDRFPNRFKIKSGNVDDAFGIVITDSQNHTAGDLIDVTDFLNALMKYLKYNKTDYEIDYKGNHLIMAIYTNKTTTKADVA